MGAWIGTVSGDDLTPYIELAKHHEWHTLDLARARLGRLGLRIAQGWPAGFPGRNGGGFASRLERLDEAGRGKESTLLRQNSVADLSTAAGHGDLLPCASSQHTIFSVTFLCARRLQ